jgi:hypothetical protein
LTEQIPVVVVVAPVQYAVRVPLGPTAPMQSKSCEHGCPHTRPQVMQLGTQLNPQSQLALDVQVAP